MCRSPRWTRLVWTIVVTFAIHSYAESSGNPYCYRTLDRPTPRARAFAHRVSLSRGYLRKRKSKSGNSFEVSINQTHSHLTSPNTNASASLVPPPRLVSFTTRQISTGLTKFDFRSAMGGYPPKANALFPSFHDFI